MYGLININRSIAVIILALERFKLYCFDITYFRCNINNYKYTFIIALYVFYILGIYISLVGYWCRWTCDTSTRRAAPTSWSWAWTCRSSTRPSSGTSSRCRPSGARSYPTRQLACDPKIQNTSSLFIFSTIFSNFKIS